MLEADVEVSKNGPVVAVFRDRALALKWSGVPEDLLRA